LTPVDAEVTPVAPPTGFEEVVVVGEPAEPVIEGPVLHHHDDDVVDARVGRRALKHVA
jgi:hypothetical protein